MPILKAAARKMLESLDLYWAYSLWRGGFLREEGWYRSMREQASVDAQGKPLPWITYPAIDFLAARIKPHMHVFEFGCGGSTRWWAERVERVVSCEHDCSWYERVAPHLPSNAALHHVALEVGGEYCRTAQRSGETFDIIVIDGRDRVNCASASLDSLKPDGVFIWDNSDRTDYEQGFQALFERGFKKLEFRGMAPMVGIKNETSIFYRPENCLGI